MKLSLHDTPAIAFPFDPVEFFELAQRANRAAASYPSGSMEQQTAFALNIGGHFARDQDQFDSFMLRWFALSEHLLSGDLEREHPNCRVDVLERAAIESAAVLPLTNSGRIERAVFLSKVADKLKTS